MPTRLPRWCVFILLLCVWAHPSIAQDQTRPQRQQRGTLGGAIPLPPGTREVRDVAYVKGGGKSQSLDLFIPPGADKPLPLVIWIHGGGWQNGDKANNPARALLHAGYVVASINYRLTDEAIFPAQINDCKAAVRWLRANADEHHIDSDRIGVWGASAGGHLVALLGTAGDAKDLEGDGGNETVSSKVQAVCDFFGPADLTKISDESSANGAVPKLLGGPIRDNQAKARQASPVTYASADDPPFLILHGTKDPLVGVRQSKWLHEALEKAGVETHLEILDGAGHGGPEFATAKNRRLIVEFFDKHLKQTATTKPSR